MDSHVKKIMLNMYPKRDEEIPQEDDNDNDQDNDEN